MVDFFNYNWTPPHVLVSTLCAEFSCELCYELFMSCCELLSFSAWISTTRLAVCFIKLHPKILWKEVFPILTWTIWSSHNKVAMEGDNFNKMIKSFMTEQSHLQSNNFSPYLGKETSNKSCRLIGWKPPPLDSSRITMTDQFLEILANGKWIWAVKFESPIP